MCSVQENELEGPVPKEALDIEKDCMKCKTQKATVVSRVNAFCKDCFLVYVTHKFRATIGKSKLIRDGDKVLVAYSGGPSSSCLLNLIKEGLGQNAHKKLRFNPALLFIDEDLSLEELQSDSKSSNRKIVEIVADSGFPVYKCSLAQAFDVKHSENEDTGNVADLSGGKEQSITELKHSMKAADELKSLLSSMTSLTAKEDILHRLKQQIYIEIARTYGYSKVMTGHSATRLAVTLMTDISQGRGSQVGMDTTFADYRLADITFVKPIRDLSAKEVAVYNAFMNVPTVVIPTLTTKTLEGSSIEHLTEAFVVGLQTEYPSTISNIMRTGEKLTSDNNSKSDNSHCSLCQAPLDTNVGLSSALSAVQFSQKISTKPKSSGACHNDTECCGEGDGSCHSKDDGLTLENIRYTMCYGCRLTFKDLSDSNKLPEFLLQDISWRVRRSKMKADISDFLLEPESS